MNSTTRAFHATPSPLYEKESPLRRDLSMLLITIKPSALKMPGIQSTKLTWKSEPLTVLEKVAASMRTKKAMENYIASVLIGKVVAQC